MMGTAKAAIQTHFAETWKKMVSAMNSTEALACDIIVGNTVEVHNQLADMNNDPAGVALVILAKHRNQRRSGGCDFGYSKIERPDNDTVVLQGPLAEQFNAFLKFANNSFCRELHTNILV